MLHGGGGGFMDIVNVESRFIALSHFELVSQINGNYKIVIFLKKVYSCS
jgi:hypothetical protein